MIMGKLADGNFTRKRGLPGRGKHLEAFWKPSMEEKGVEEAAGLRGRQLSPTIGAAGSAGLYDDVLVASRSGLFGVYCFGGGRCRRHVLHSFSPRGISGDATVLAPSSTHNYTNISIVMPAAGTRWLAGRPSVFVKFPRALGLLAWARNVKGFFSLLVFLLGGQAAASSSPPDRPMTRAISHFHFLRCLHYLALLLLPWTWLDKTRQDKTKARQGQARQKPFET
ncbi:hypothetical protein GGI35DRAFT_59565 [Trichoderma velutinum]